ncbi:hypothetical protein L21SP3_01151 [Sedimentisphaera cyanobacteriorum]|uniref:Uncharacterized protein n=2 Tax=Sedimentisphaera cyanobacteriorum TaxID=1940790 RepID=A0A1Q2HPH2_9BACT|nr:hypothetical protein L21SP3_01151 [Sedimentisphaera cyanobacteriorum]
MSEKTYTPLSRCKNCSTIFCSRMIGGIGNPRKFQSVGNMENCPKCNNMAYAAEAAYEPISNELIIINNISDKDIKPLYENEITQGRVWGL